MLIIKTIAELVSQSTIKKNTVISVAVAEDSHVLEAVSEAHQQGIADFILVGDEAKIRTIADQIQMDLTLFEIVHMDDVNSAAYKAVELVSQGRANVLMKGLVDTTVIMKAVLDRQIGIRSERKLSHLAVFEVAAYHKLLFVTDAAVNIAPDLEGKIQIIENAITAVHKLGLPEPKVALICAKEKVDEKMPVTIEYEKIVQMNRCNQLTGAIIDGPFALDVAVSKESAATKGVVSSVCGDADILLCPDIEAGNILYKSLVFMANAKNGGIVLGAKAPIIMTSRADSSESKRISIALGVLFQ